MERAECIVSQSLTRREQETGGSGTLAFNLCSVHGEHKPLVLKITNAYDFVLVLRQVK